MRIFNGTPIGFNIPKMGVVSKGKTSVFSRTSSILVTNNTDCGLLGYSGVITSEDMSKIKTSKPVISNVSFESVEMLHDGDVITINPDGRIIVLWESTKADNCLFITSQCNSHCIMCPQPTDEMPVDFPSLNLKILDLINSDSAKYVGITGGEPTLFMNELCQVLMKCKKRIPEAPIALLTNGRRYKDFSLTKTIVDIGNKNLSHCIPLYADIDRIHDEIVRVPGAFSETINGIYNLALLKETIEIRVVLLQKNYMRLPSLAEFISNNLPFVSHVAFMGLETRGVAYDNINSVWIEPVEYAQELDKAINCLDKRGISASIYNLPLCVIPKHLWKFKKKSISEWKRSYPEVCLQCEVKAKCGGIFSTSRLQSKFIKPIVTNG